MSKKQNNLSPQRIVENLDRNIIGQNAAKKSVAIAFRNRWRRLNVEDELMRAEITPKNLLMIGPTGVGKTEIARRLAKLADAPFIKVEATKFTEVGYVGRDVDSIIRDLMEVSYKMAREHLENRLRSKAKKRAIAKIVDGHNPADEAERRKIELRIEAGEMDDTEATVKITPGPPKLGMNISGSGAELMPHQLEEISRNLGSILGQIGNKQRKEINRKVKISEAIEILVREELNRNIDDDEVKNLAIHLAEESGIVFIDEIDKIASSGGMERAEVSRQGVQRDLLPLIEGTTVPTKFGSVSTDHILFVTSGSFHYASPSDLIPELQGRLPIRVNLEALGIEDFVRILSETQNCLTKQYASLLATEGLQVEFTPDSVRRIAEIAFEVNGRQENIGARRLHTLMERLVEDISFRADQLAGTSYTFQAQDVDKTLGKLAEDTQATRLFL